LFVGFASSFYKDVFFAYLFLLYVISKYFDSNQYLFLITIGFPHVIAFENDKAAAEAAKALVEKNVDGLGLDAPGVNNPTGKECKTWIVNFMDTKMKQNDDGQWIFLVAGITRATVQALHTRVQLWKSKPDSASYQSHYTKFQASLLNAVRALPV
jgi:hypothetical protein